MKSLIDPALFQRAYGRLYRNEIDSDEFYNILNTNANEIVQPELKKTTYTYVFEVERGTYKIGKSKDVERRFKELSAGNPNLKIMATCPVDIEKSLHKVFSAGNTERELFELDYTSAKDLINIVMFFNSIYCGPLPEDDTPVRIIFRVVSSFPSLLRYLETDFYSKFYY